MYASEVDSSVTRRFQIGMVSLPWEAESADAKHRDPTQFNVLLTSKGDDYGKKTIPGLMPQGAGMEGQDSAWLGKYDICSQKPSSRHKKRRPQQKDPRACLMYETSSIK